jgi:hypothetical protein
MKAATGFPQFRKYKNGSSWFRIDSPENFEEIRQLGEKWMIEQFEARILPDHHLVNDLLYNYSAFAVEIGEADYRAMRQKASQAG